MFKRATSKNVQTGNVQGNIHDKGIVTVPSSSTGTGSLSDVVDFSSEDGFSTLSEPTAWICYDSKDRIVAPTGISVLFGPEMVPLLRVENLFSFEISLNRWEWTAVQFGGSGFTRRNPRLYLLHLPGRFQECRFARLRVPGKDTSMPLSGISWEVFGHVRMAIGDEELSVVPAVNRRIAIRVAIDLPELEGSRKLLVLTV
jgi:hypothetical protein